MTDFTLGVEEEFQIVNQDTFALESAMTRLLELAESSDIQPELHESVVEVATPVCNDVHEARREISRNRQHVISLAKKVGCRILAASTHPFSPWEQQIIHSGKSDYEEMVRDLQDVARANVIFGMHIHVCIDDPEERIAVYNSARYFLPHLLALSTSSPFWNGRNTGLQSVRSVIFKRLPRTGVPGIFQSYADFDQMMTLLVATESIKGKGRVWWDLRPHYHYGTLEFRVCDVPTSIHDVVSLVALAQCLCHRLLRMHRNNQQWRMYPSALIEENKWRAARYSVHGKMIDFGKQREVHTRDIIEELYLLLEPDAKALGCLTDLQGILRIAEYGTSSDRQLAVFEAHGGLANFDEAMAAVAHAVAKETSANLDASAPAPRLVEVSA
ncbi:MAG: carboxylate-amine ligase [Myxococcota bacterium]|nr:carboxylate-amine ligase [Myxococcota bacterium]